MNGLPSKLTDPGGGKLPRQPMSAGRQLAQRIPLLVVKAGFSTLPLAVFAFDVFQNVVDFGNAHLTDRFLESVGARIERLEANEQERERERLKADPVYQRSGRAALQRLLTETNPRMADALARAVAEIGASDLPDVERLEIARALDALTEPSLHLLQTLYRAHHDLLTEPEIQAAGGDASSLFFTGLIYQSMWLSSWIVPAMDLERAGLIEATLDNTTFAEAVEASRADQGHTVHMRRVYAMGERVVKMCFDDPAVPAFGEFAAAS
ncbi:hypothetical protein [Methylobacterium sp. J-070]|uniref:hypothetical protein n=1 Tax=Methylobacterium sp. J-070 TaxID=2836650 RepID=UPI001FB937D9|nr:hypothetical protein [Methylobacterium sp. J-070]MCJ2054759.1 hypothetical protein [Methylobacterium sp. J-070]